MTIEHGIKKETPFEIKVTPDTIVEIGRALEASGLFRWRGATANLSALSYDHETETVLVDKKLLMRAICQMNPMQDANKNIRLLGDETDIGICQMIMDMAHIAIEKSIMYDKRGHKLGVDQKRVDEITEKAKTAILLIGDIANIANG